MRLRCAYFEVNQTKPFVDNARKPQIWPIVNPLGDNNYHGAENRTIFKYLPNKHTREV